MTAKTASSVHKTTARVAAIVLAAGEAQRYGAPKALLPWRDHSLLRHCVETALASGCSEVHVALGANATELESEIEDLPVEAFHHEAWRDGMGTTLAAAVGRVGSKIDGVVVLLCDQPFVTPAVINQIVGAGGVREMAACEYRGTLGPPAYFAASQLDRLRELSGDRGAKALLLENPEAVATIAFPDGAFDIDTPEDYDRALNELQRRSQ